MEGFYPESGRPINPCVVPTPILTSNRTAATELWQFKFFTQTLVQEVRADILGAGTGATAGYTIFKNTTSIGVVTCGVTGTGTVVDASLTDTFFAAGDALVLKNVTSDAGLEAALAISFLENHERGY